ncbi:MAG TPA: hypothetical protein VFN67_04000 [Polyangiales bacterium]|nr:hypothetical protein [Polyangiales bacterium]
MTTLCGPEPVAVALAGLDAVQVPLPAWGAARPAAPAWGVAPPPPPAAAATPALPALVELAPAAAVVGVTDAVVPPAVFTGSLVETGGLAVDPAAVATLPTPAEAPAGPAPLAGTLTVPVGVALLMAAPVVGWLPLQAAASVAIASVIAHSATGLVAFCSSIWSHPSVKATATISFLPLLGRNIRFFWLFVTIGGAESREAGSLSTIAKMIST